MKNSVSTFKASKMTKEIVKEFGTSTNDISIPMRPCQDVPEFIEKIEKAHQETANSKLHFGPINNT